MTQKYREFHNLPVVRPATALSNNYQDSLLQRTHQTPEESERLDKILAHYQEDVEREIAAEAEAI